MVEYFDKMQWNFQVDEVAEAKTTDKVIFLADLKLTTDKEAKDDVREQN